MNDPVTPPPSAAPSAQTLRVLQLLAARYPSISAAHVEMINVSSLLALPKGTDHYISDIHGAYEQFDHMLRHASGAIRRKVSQTFGDALSEGEQVELAMLIYYPEAKIQQVRATQGAGEAWLATTIGRLARVARMCAYKYTTRTVRERLDPPLAPILEELLTESEGDFRDQAHYFDSIVQAIVALGEGETVIITLAYLIQSLVVDRLFILGDIYDRGPAAEKVMDRLMAFHHVTIQWGNHDISWMGAASGCEALIANVLRLSLRYANLETLLNGYQISLRRLARFAEETYGDDPCEAFEPVVATPIEAFSHATIARMHKAIAIIQFKLEARIIQRHPEYQMDDRLVLDTINMARGSTTLYGDTYPLRDAHWPTLFPHDRAALTAEEAAVVDDLRQQFEDSERLQAHIRFLYSFGNMFEVQDGHLKFHGYLPVDEQGEFVSFPLAGETLGGPALLARFEQVAREAFFSRDGADRQIGQDAMWYLWCGQHSPLFGRRRMTTFERYFVADPATHVEPKGPYYALRDSEAFCRKVLAAFGGDVEYGFIINGHTPVRLKKGEQPLMANGKLVVIDGGMSEAYQPVTGIAGYTLIANSQEMALAAHEPFVSTEALLQSGHDVTPRTERIQSYPKRLTVADTDRGHALRSHLDDLQRLVAAYRRGVLVEQGRVGTGWR